VLKILETKLERITPLRRLFLQENHFQIRYDACHERGWSDSYLIQFDEKEVGYGSIKGQELNDRDTIFEFYLLPDFRKHASQIFTELITISRARLIECQSNDIFLTSLLYEFAQNISSDVVLFEDAVETELTASGVTFRPIQKNDDVFEHQVEPVGEYILELAGEVAATGGFALHYNKPFADLYMEVKPDHRKRGLGSFLIQELKNACYLAGRVPAARCNIQNKASRVTLLKAGMKVCGFMLLGQINT